MKIFLWIVSALWIIVGIVSLISPAGLKKFYSSLLKPLKWLAILAIIAGLLFLWAAPASSLSWFIRLLGILGLIKGLSFLLCPIGMVRATLSWWLNQSSKTYRLIGILALLLAGLIISSIL